MIIDISNSEFRKLFNDKKLFLPIVWDNNDFKSNLKELFDYYLNELKKLSKDSYDFFYYNIVESACYNLISAVDYYLNGFPSKAYESFEKAMRNLMKKPLNIDDIIKDSKEQCDILRLFRVASVGDNRPYGRERIFHTPYNLRSKVSTSRYSIAGYPSLYLGTSLELCCEEVHINPQQDLAITSIFRLMPHVTNIQIIELGIKPQDFLEENYRNEQFGRKISLKLLNTATVQTEYILWYPLIAACSYIRVNKKDPFATEYIIPQLLMQWVRNEIAHSTRDNEKLIGIRYFSCASKEASNMGFNYVFPTSGEQLCSSLPYCKVLARSFCLSKPVYIHKFNNVMECQKYLLKTRDFDFICEKNLFLPYKCKKIPKNYCYMIRDILDGYMYISYENYNKFKFLKKQGIKDPFIDFSIAIINGNEKEYLRLLPRVYQKNISKIINEILEKYSDELKDFKE